MSIFGSKMKKTIAAGLAAVTLGGAAIASATPASAQWGWGRGYGYGHGYRPYYGGGAVAAGLVGGLALGALAARPAYGYAPVGYYGGYAPVGYGYGGECFIERRRTVDPWGRVIVRRVRTCY
jgi:hypothetical protein